MILPKDRDPRFITVRRGGTLQDADHRLLAVWAADCAQHVLHFFEQTQPSDDRPRRAIEQARAWARGEITMTQARTAALAAHAAAREAFGAARKRRMPPVTPWRWLMWQLTNSAQRPTRSGPHVRRLLKISARRLVAWSASGSVHSFPARSENSCSMTRGCAMRSAGPYSIADRLARTTATAQQPIAGYRCQRRASA